MPTLETILAQGLSVVACSEGGLGSLIGTVGSGAKGERRFWQFGFTDYFVIGATCGSKSGPAVFCLRAIFGCG
jgi:hypothetical protein